MNTRYAAFDPPGWPFVRAYASTRSASIVKHCEHTFSAVRFPIAMPLTSATPNDEAVSPSRTDWEFDEIELNDRIAVCAFGPGSGVALPPGPPGKVSSGL